MENSSHKIPESVIETLKLISRKWAVQVLNELNYNSLSFGEIRNIIPLSSPVLSDLLRELIENDIVEKRKISSSPEKFIYHITEFGSVLCKIIENIMEWGQSLINLKNEVSVKKFD